MQIRWKSKPRNAQDETRLYTFVYCSVVIMQILVIIMLNLNSIVFEKVNPTKIQYFFNLLHKCKGILHILNLSPMSGYQERQFLHNSLWHFKLTFKKNTYFFKIMIKFNFQ